MTETESYESSEQTDRNSLKSFLYEEETSFMDDYHAEVDERLAQMEQALDEKGSVVKPVTPFGLGSMLALMVLFFIMAMISWYGGPVG